MKLLTLIIGILIMAQNSMAAKMLDAASYTVKIRTSIKNSFAQDDIGTINGAGFLVDRNLGLIVTNAHVSGRGNSQIKVAFQGEEYIDAKLIYVDPYIDVAVLEVSNELLPKTSVEAVLQCQKLSRQGFSVAAYGHPQGLSFSATRGIVSRVRTFDGNDWVQTDAAINPGNSGGPLISTETGRVVGVNSRGFKHSEGLNFAVPIPSVCSIVNLLREKERSITPKSSYVFCI